MSNSNKEKQKGNEYFAQKDFLKAIHHYTKSLELDPSSSIVYGNRSLCYIKLSKYKEAIEDSTKSIELDPNYAKAYHRRAFSYFYLHDWKNSLEDFKKFLLIEDKPGLKIEIENYVKAISNHIDEKLETSCSQVEFEVGNLFKQQGELEKSIEYYSKAISFKKNYSFFFTRGKTYYTLYEKNNDERYLNHSLKDLDESLLMCKELYEQEKILSFRGNINFTLKRYQEALDDFQRAYKIKKSEDNLLDLEKAHKYIQKEEYGKVKLPDSERVKRITKNQDIMNELSDPLIRKIFERIKRNPKKIKMYLTNDHFKKLMENIVKEIEE